MGPSICQVNNKRLLSEIKILAYCGYFGFDQLPGVVLGLMCNMLTDFNKTKLTMAKFRLNTGLIKIIVMVALSWWSGLTNHNNWKRLIVKQQAREGERGFNSPSPRPY